MSKEQKVVAIVPAFNEEKGIAKTLSDLKQALRLYLHEIVVVDGHSSDKTVEVAKKHGALVLFQMAKGYGDALITGFLYATERLNGNILVTLDADASYDPYDVPKLLDPIMRKEADYVVGWRIIDANAMPLASKFGNQAISWATRHLLKIPLHDSQSGIFAFRSDLVDQNEFETKGWALNTELLKTGMETGMTIKELPVRYHPRLGESKLNIMRGGLDNIKIILKMMKNTEPLRFFGLGGVFFIAIGLLAGTSVFLGWIPSETEASFETVIVLALSICFGVLLFGLGIVSNKIKQTRPKRPRKQLHFETA
jgi:glycosyltransferase involved in cell wall biosynthesis